MIQDHQLVFLISQPRSGSTLLQKLIAGSPRIDTCAEPWVALPIINMLSFESQPIDYNRRKTQMAVHEFLNRYNLQDTFDSERKNMLLNMYSSALTDSENLFLDKTPRYYMIVEELQQMFPSAKFILLKRNPLKVLSSAILTWSKNSIESLDNIFPDILDAPTFMLNAIQKGGKNPQVHTLKYEDLVKEPEEELRAIYKFLGIPGDELDMTGDSDAVAGMYGDKTRAIGSEGIERGNTQFALSDIPNGWQKFFLGYIDYLGDDFFKQYGYELPAVGKSTNSFRYFLYRREKTKERYRSASKSLKEAILIKTGINLF